MTKDAHATPSSAAQEPLYDLSVATPTHAERARTLAAEIPTATLCTIGQEPAGYPYGSLATYALADGHPVFLISDLAEHTRNLRKDSRASLLIAQGGADDPLANGRITLVGDCTPCDDPRARAAYLERHPNAGYYADFKDFHVWRLEVTALRYIGGYGRMSWVPVEAWLAAEPDPIAPFADGIIAHMNDDHADAMPLYCRAFSKAQDIEVATMTSIDRYGFEMSAQTKDGPRPVRLAFAQPISSRDEARKALVGLLQEARATLGSE
jgi:heme iron utilization protein